MSPTIQTSYQAHWRTANSPSVTINVAPARRLRPQRQALRREGDVRPRRTRATTCWVQRKAPLGSFRNVKRIYLGANSRAVFRAKLPKGRSILRLVLPDSQAGVGYVASTSRLIPLTR